MGILKKAFHRNNSPLFGLLLFSYISLCYSCAQTPDRHQRLVVDTLAWKIDYLQCIEESKPSSGFILDHDSLAFLAFVTEDSNLLRIKSIFSSSYDYTINLENLLNHSFQNEVMISYDKDSFYFFPLDSACYYTVSFVDIKTQQIPRANQYKPHFLQYFTDTAYYSTGSSLPIVINGARLIIPYRLRQATNENLIDSTAYYTVDQFRQTNPLISKIGKFPEYGFQNYDLLIRQVYTIDKSKEKFYYTNKKSDRIYSYSFVNRITSTFPIPSTHNVSYNKDMKNSTMDEERKYKMQNDINFNLFVDTKENFYLIRKKPSPENNRKYEVLGFSKSGDLIDSIIIQSNHFNVPLAFIYNDQIYIPNGAHHTYFVVSLQLSNHKS
jgi:hypothetical protein